MIKFLSLIVLLFSFSTFAGSLHETTVHFPPDQNGYDVTATFSWRFTDQCPGMLVLVIGRDRESASVYVHEGKNYNPRDLGLNSFEGRSLFRDPPTLYADVYHGQRNLGRVELDHVRSGIGQGCIGGRYHRVFGDLGLNGLDYVDSISQLSLRNFSVSRSNTTDYELNRMIRRQNEEKERQRREEEREARQAEEEARMREQNRKAQEQREKRESSTFVPGEVRRDSSTEMSSSQNDEAARLRQSLEYQRMRMDQQNQEIADLVTPESAQLVGDAVVGSVKFVGFMGKAFGLAFLDPRFGIGFGWASSERSPNNMTSFNITVADFENLGDGKYGGYANYAFVFGYARGGEAPPRFDENDLVLEEDREMLKSSIFYQFTWDIFKTRQYRILPLFEITLDRYDEYHEDGRNVQVSEGRDILRSIGTGVGLMYIRSAFSASALYNVGNETMRFNLTFHSFTW